MSDSNFARICFRLISINHHFLSPCPTPVVLKLIQSSDSHGRFRKAQNAGLHPHSLRFSRFGVGPENLHFYMSPIVLMLLIQGPHLRASVSGNGESLRDIRQGNDKEAGRRSSRKKHDQRQVKRLRGSGPGVR